MEHDHMSGCPPALAQDDKTPSGQGLPPTFSKLSTPKLQHQPQPQFTSEPFFFSHRPPQQPPSLLQPNSHSPLPLHLLPPPSPPQSHEPSSLSFADIPDTELAPIQPHGDNGPGANNTLPSLSSLTGSQLPHYHRVSQLAEHSYSPPPPEIPVKYWPSLNPLTAYYAPSHMQPAEPLLKMDLDGSSTGAKPSSSPECYYDGRASSVSLDDPDVRMAAEALGDLRADFVSSPPKHSNSLSTSPHSDATTLRPPPEPLFSLLTTSHPLLATTIENATSVYNSSKNYSPRFKSSAEYVEGYLTPIANTVGNVGRVTGVEGGVRWFLGAGRRHQPSTDLEHGTGGSNKRRKVDTSSGKALDAAADRMPIADTDPYGFTSKDRRTSMSTVDTLPAYDDYCSPAYSESVEAYNQAPSRPSSSSSAAWQQRLIMSTSGLSIAMSEESLRSLKYCLRWLRWANEHIARVITALKNTLEQYEGPQGTTINAELSEKQGSGNSAMNETLASETDQGRLDHRRELAARISELKRDVLKTLRDVIETVSKYAGGALPENARVLVRRHLTSLPQRFRLAAMQDASSQAQDDGAHQEKEMREGAQRVLVLAKEGLDMMAQVSGVLDGTIVSAEEWCERLGRKKRDEREALTGAAIPPNQPPTGMGTDGDVKMS